MYIEPHRCLSFVSNSNSINSINLACLTPVRSVEGGLIGAYITYSLIIPVNILEWRCLLMTDTPAYDVTDPSWNFYYPGASKIKF